LFIVNISLPESVEKALDTRTSMGVIGDMGRFQQYQMGNAMTSAAESGGGGGASEGLGLGLGMAMASRMMPGMAGGSGAAPGTPPPPPVDAWYLAVDGASQGPFTTAQMESGITAGQVSEETLVWKTGMPNWLAAKTVAPLSTAFAGSTPPPIPGS
jgi:hypothetical protein